MIKISKDLGDIPDKLKNKQTEEAFNKNINGQNYIDSKDRYKSKGVQNQLFKIYNGKCAYCERIVSKDNRSIDHYRPKSKYYWLSYSWDNLLLSCTKCNLNKGNNFKIQNNKMEYNNESFENIHTLCKDYNNKESPSIVNPEIDCVIDDIVFSKQGDISSENEKVSHTIKELELNREDIREARLNIINNFKSKLNEEIILSSKNKKRLSSYIETFKKESINNNEEYYSLHSFIRKNMAILLA